MAEVIENRKARHLYEITDKVEAGLMLTGSEVKALRAGHASLGEAYAGIPVSMKQKGAQDGLFLINAYIGAYKPAGASAHAPRRPRRLLLHKKQQTKLAAASREAGMTLVPLQIYFNAKGIAKLELGLGRGRKKYEHRDRDKKRDWQKRKGRLLRRTAQS